MTHPVKVLHDYFKSLGYQQLAKTLCHPVIELDQPVQDPDLPALALDSLVQKLHHAIKALNHSVRTLKLVYATKVVRTIHLIH